MPINVGLTFLIGGALGWLAVKLLKPGLHLEGLVIATCAAGSYFITNSFDQFYWVDLRISNKCIKMITYNFRVNN